MHGTKLDALEDIIEAANGQTVLVSYWYRHDREHIQRRFPQARELKTSAEIEAWNRGDIPLGLVHPASAGHGVNLQSGGHLLVWFSLTWSLELYQQTSARLYRQGQAESVTITHLTATDTLDQAVLKALEAKDMTQAALIDAVATELTTISRKESSCMWACWRKIRTAYITAHPLCEDCLAAGRYTPSQEVQHAIPLEHGGTHDQANLRSLCKPRHSRQSALDGDRWRQTPRVYTY